MRRVIAILLSLQLIVPAEAFLRPSTLPATRVCDRMSAQAFLSPILFATQTYAANVKVGVVEQIHPHIASAATSGKPSWVLWTLIGTVALGAIGGVVALMSNQLPQSTVIDLYLDQSLLDQNPSKVGAHLRATNPTAPFRLHLALEGTAGFVESAAAIGLQPEPSLKMQTVTFLSRMKPDDMAKVEYDQNRDGEIVVTIFWKRPLVWDEYESQIQTTVLKLDKPRENMKAAVRLWLESLKPLAEKKLTDAQLDAGLAGLIDYVRDSNQVVSLHPSSPMVVSYALPKADPVKEFLDYVEIAPTEPIAGLIQCEYPEKIVEKSPAPVVPAPAPKRSEEKVKLTPVVASHPITLIVDPPIREPDQLRAAVFHDFRQAIDAVLKHPAVRRMGEEWKRQQAGLAPTGSRAHQETKTKAESLMVDLIRAFGSLESIRIDASSTDFIAEVKPVLEILNEFDEVYASMDRAIDEMNAIQLLKQTGRVDYSYDVYLIVLHQVTRMLIHRIHSAVVRGKRRLESSAHGASLESPTVVEKKAVLSLFTQLRREVVAARPRVVASNPHDLQAPLADVYDDVIGFLDSRLIGPLENEDVLSAASVFALLDRLQNLLGYEQRLKWPIGKAFKHRKTSQHAHIVALCQQLCDALQWKQMSMATYFNASEGGEPQAANGAQQPDIVSLLHGASVAQLQLFKQILIRELEYFALHPMLAVQNPTVASFLLQAVPGHLKGMLELELGRMARAMPHILKKSPAEFPTLVSQALFLVSGIDAMRTTADQVLQMATASSPNLRILSTDVVNRLHLRNVQRGMLDSLVQQIYFAISASRIGTVETLARAFPSAEHPHEVVIHETSPTRNPDVRDALLAFEAALRQVSESSQHVPGGQSLARAYALLAEEVVVMQTRWDTERSSDGQWFHEFHRLFSHVSGVVFGEWGMLWKTSEGITNLVRDEQLLVAQSGGRLMDALKWNVDAVTFFLGSEGLRRQRLHEAA